MKNIKIIIGLLFILLSSGISAQGNLNRYLKSAAQNNPDIKVKFNAYMAALEVVPQAKALPDPQAAFAFFISPVETRVGPQRLKLAASQLFPWFGTLKAQENVAIQAAKAKYELFEETKSKLFQEVKASYFNLYFNQKAVEISLENIEILQSFRKLANIKIESGLVSMVDAYRIDMEINELENQLALLKDKEIFLDRQFRLLLNDNGEQKIELPHELWTTDLLFTKEAVLDSIAKSNHQLLRIDFQKAALTYKQEVASLRGKPNFKIGLDYTIIGKGSNNLSGKDAFVFPTIGLSIPLYRNKYKAMIQEVVLLSTAKDNAKQAKANRLETLFEKTWKDYQDGNRRIGLFKKQVLLAQQSLKLLETEYTSGNKNFEEILRMERKVLKYNLEQQKAKSDKQAAIAFIYYLMGK